MCCFIGFFYFGYNCVVLSNKNLVKDYLVCCFHTTNTYPGAVKYNRCLSCCKLFKKLYQLKHFQKPIHWLTQQRGAQQHYIVTAEFYLGGMVAYLITYWEVEIILPERWNCLIKTYLPNSVKEIKTKFYVVISQ